MATSKQEAVELGCDYSTAFQAACTAASLEGMTVKAADPQTGRILLSSTLSAMSWGEDVAVRVGVAGDRTLIEVTSSLKFGLVDWGKNKRNIDKLLARIATVAQAGPLPAGQAAGVAPSPVPLPASPTPGAAWHPDPYRRHQLRYWDGTWTAHVSDDGIVGTDPV